jgi:hypothetical protein
VQGDEITREVTSIGDRIPKIIDPTTHAVLDYTTAGSFFALGFAMLGRHRRASTLAFINGGAVLGLSLFTDYPGGVWRKLSFRTHGMVDLMQAAMAATMPALLGFAGDPEAQAFHAQAAVELGVIAATDWRATAAAAA